MSDYMHETPYAIATFKERVYSRNKPVFTLFLWKKCGACPRFVTALEDTYKNKNLWTDIQVVYLDEDPDRIAKDVSSFPTLRKTFKGKTTPFPRGTPDIHESLATFLTSK